MSAHLTTGNLHEYIAGDVTTDRNISAYLVTPEMLRVSESSRALVPHRTALKDFTASNDPHGLGGRSELLVKLMKAQLHPNRLVIGHEFYVPEIMVLDDFLSTITIIELRLPAITVRDMGALCGAITRRSLPNLVTFDLRFKASNKYVREACDFSDDCDFIDPLLVRQLLRALSGNTCPKLEHLYLRVMTDNAPISAVYISQALEDGALSNLKTLCLPVLNRGNYVIADAMEHIPRLNDLFFLFQDHDEDYLDPEWYQKALQRCTRLTTNIPYHPRLPLYVGEPSPLRMLSLSLNFNQDTQGLIQTVSRVAEASGAYRIYMVGMVGMVRYGSYVVVLYCAHMVARC